MERIYHPWQKWEDHKHGFYDNCSGDKKKVLAEKVLELFSNEDLCREYMYRVVNEWRDSCEQNLTNSSMNKIAYIGQSACCLYAGIPSSVTMENWRFVPKSDRDRADEIAKEVLAFWEKVIYNGEE
jgi:hypothetical protein